MKKIRNVKFEIRTMLSKHKIATHCFLFLLLLGAIIGLKKSLHNNDEAWLIKSLMILITSIIWLMVPIRTLFSELVIFAISRIKGETKQTTVVCFFMAFSGIIVVILSINYLSFITNDAEINQCIWRMLCEFMQIIGLLTITTSIILLLVNTKKLSTELMKPEFSSLLIAAETFGEITNTFPKISDPFANYLSILALLLKVTLIIAAYCLQTRINNKFAVENALETKQKE